MKDVRSDGTRRWSDVNWQEALYIPLTILAWLAVIVIAGWLLGHVVKTVLTLVLSGIVAFALTPLVSLLHRWMPRGVAILVAYLVGFAIVLGILALVITTAATQVSNLVANLPVYARDVHRFEPQIVRAFGPFGLTHARYASAEQELITSLRGVGTAAANQSVGIVTGIIGTVVDVVLVLILSVYLTANGERIGAWLRRQTPSSQRHQTVLLIAIVNQVVGGYIRGTLMMATLIGVLVGGGLLILGVPYAVLLGVLAFFMEFVPIVGVLISGAASILIALTQGWILAVVVLGYFVVVHVIEGDVVGPRVMGRAVGIHPATALVALVAGTELFGIWGALFGAPLAGLLQAIITAAWREIQGADPKAVLRAVAEHAEVGVEQQDSGTRPAQPTRAGEEDSVTQVQ